MEKEVKNTRAKKTNIIIGILLVIAWMIVIFIFSAMAGDDSANLSSGLLHTILKVIPGLAESKTAHLIVRKLAHMTEYAILCGLILNLEYQITNKVKLKQIAIAILGSFLYACTDEWHQTFISGRSGNMLDVGIDTLGAIIAMVFLFAIVQIRKIKQES